MSRGASKDYDFYDKNNWVRMIWNQVLRRTKGRQQSEAIVYLCGPDDFDREIAVRRGVPSRNLVAVDIDKSNVDRVRKAGHAAICGDVFDVLKAWPSNKPVCALVLDFCQGLQRLPDLERLMAIQMMNPALSRAVIALNLQRGRDAQSNAERELVGDMIKRHKELPDDGSLNLWHGRYKELIADIDEKHRGLIFSMWYLVVGFKKLEKCERTQRLAVIAGSLGTVMLQILLDSIKPRFFTYQSSGKMVYDSVVMYPFSNFFMADPSADHQSMRDFIGKSPRKVSKSLTATLAVRTRRMNQERANP